MNSSRKLDLLNFKFIIIKIRGMRKNLQKKKVEALMV